MTPAHATAKATALLAAWRAELGTDPPSLETLLLPLAQAQFETQCGDAWGVAHNWGACDLRALSATEMIAASGGTLRAGDWLHKDGSSGGPHRPDDVGILEVDSHPGGTTFRVWFAAFPDDVAGARYFLRVVLRSARAVLADPDATPIAYATALYLGCYYEGTHAGARPCGKRALPLTPPEAANVMAYAHVVSQLHDQFLALLPDFELAPPPVTGRDPGGPADEVTTPRTG